MSDANIPLLTDVVLEDDAEADAPEQQAIDGIEGIEDVAVFEADDTAGDTNKHYMPAAQDWEQTTMEVVDTVEISDFENVVAELQTRIASHTYELTDQLLRAAFSDIEAKVFRQISTNLRQQLPELIDAVVREHLLERDRQSEE